MIDNDGLILCVYKSTTQIPLTHLGIVTHKKYFKKKLRQKVSKNASKCINNQQKRFFYTRAVAHEYLFASKHKINIISTLPPVQWCEDKKKNTHNNN